MWARTCRSSSSDEPWGFRGTLKLMEKIKAALIGSGNIGTDLMYKALRSQLDQAGLDGRHRSRFRRPRKAREHGPADHRGGRGRAAAALERDGIRIAFDATSAYVHRGELRASSPRAGVLVIDLTPAAIGPYCVPPVNLCGARRQARDERQHGQLRRAGDHPDGRCGQPRAASRLRGDRRHGRLALRRPRHAQEHRRVHAHHRGAASRKSAAPSAARPSSSSTRPSRR